MPASDLIDLIHRVRSGDRRGLARALSWVEDRHPEAVQLVAALYPATRRALVAGITGPPGAGKSTLVDRLAERARKRSRRVAILAFDPSSVFTGGALLGDRARMESGARDPEVFIRSMATRGHVGGLAAAAFEAITLLEAAGYDFVLVETVGVGQDEIEVAGAAGVTCLVLAPGAGDELQAHKAGVLEIADLLVVNKSDREGADRLAADLEAARPRGGERAPILRTVALSGEGADGVLEAIERLGAAGPSRDEVRRRRFVESWLWEIVRQIVKERVREEDWDEAVRAVLARRENPFSAAERLVDAAARKENE